MKELEPSEKIIEFITKIIPEAKMVSDVYAEISF